uniref:Uncharacterized protein n=1 Tax=Varanus komodoensis TaxID=61221 RepID=A0A8D2ISH8_VARKO
VALLMEATLPKTGSGLMLWLLESGCRELLWAHGALVFLVGMDLVDVGKQGVLIRKYFRAMDTLQIGLLRELWVPHHDVLLQLFRLVERLLTVVAHEVRERITQYQSDINDEFPKSPLAPEMILKSMVRSSKG